jgi:hypothetical protein
MADNTEPKPISTEPKPEATPAESEARPEQATPAATEPAEPPAPQSVADPARPTQSPRPPGPPTSTPLPGPFAQFLSSGVFFMLVGGGFLWAAYTTMTETHTSFTFVLVVVGVAILLYGTGTQSAGQFDSDASNVKYKVAVAGGAGVLAFLVGFGIIKEAPAIQNAFQVEKKYFRYMIEPMEDGVTDLRNYVAMVEINGERVASVTRGRRIEVYVPYFAGRRSAQMSGIVELYRVVPADRQRATATQRFAIEVDGDAFAVEDGSYDLPPFNGEPLRVSMRADERVDSSRRDALEVNAGDAPPPVAIGAQ